MIAEKNSINLGWTGYPWFIPKYQQEGDEKWEKLHNRMWMGLKASDQFGRRYCWSSRMKLKGKLLIAVWWWERYSSKNISNDRKKEMLHSHSQVMSDIKKWQAINKTITLVSAAVKK